MQFSKRYPWLIVSCHARALGVAQVDMMMPAVSKSYFFACWSLGTGLHGCPKFHQSLIKLVEANQSDAWIVQVEDYVNRDRDH